MFDSIFLDCAIALGIFFENRRSSIIHNFIMNENRGLRCVEKFRGGVHWYMMENKDFISNINFKLKKENNEIISFNGQKITFRLSIKEI